MNKVHKINGFVYVTSEELCSKNSFNGYKIVLTNDASFKAVQQLTPQEVEYLNTVDECEVVKKLIEETELDLNSREMTYYKLVYQLQLPKQEPKQKEMKAETNNGWIKIESEDDLPKIDFHTQYWLSDGKSTWIETITLNHKIGREKVTHYQPIIKPQPPIY